MFYVKQSESTAARRRVPILMVDATDGSTPETGLTLYGLVAKNGGTFASSAGTFAETGYGQYYYQFDTGEIDTLGFAGIHVTATGARNYDAIIHVTAYDAYSGSFIAPTDVWNANISAFSSAGTAGSQLNLAALPSGAGITSGDVWSYADRTITGGSVTTVVNPVSVSTTSMSGIANTVWESTTASHTTNGTYGKVVLRSDAANVVGNVTLRSAGGINMVDADVHRIDNDADAATYLKNALTGIGASWTGNIVGNVTGSVGSVTSDVNVSTASMTGIASTVWNANISAISTAGSAGTQLNLAALPSGTGITSGDVWTYVDRTITGGIADTVTTVTNTVDISTQSVTDIWSEDVSAYSTPSAGFDLTQAASGGAGITSGDVWSYVIPGPGDPAETVLANINTNASNASAQTGTSAIRDAVWDTDLSFLSGTTQAAGILYQAAAGTTLNAPSEVWSYATRTLTSGGGITAGDVWEYDISAISTAGTAGSQVNLAALPAGGVGISAYDVWAFDYLADGVVANSAAERLEETRTNTYNIDSAVGTLPSTIWSTDISSNSDPSAGFSLYQLGIGATGYSGAIGITAGDVWTYDISGVSTAGTAGSQLNLAASPSGAGITAGDVSVAVWDADPANYSNNSTFGKGILRSDNAGVAGTVSLWTGGSFSGVFADTYRIDASYDAATALKDILTGVGSTITGNITGNVSGSIGSVTNAVNVSTASMSGIANTVWSTDVSGYTSPSAGFDLSNASSGAGITAGDVWEYNISAISTAGTAGSQVNLAALPNGGGITAADVWNYIGTTVTSSTKDTLESAYVQAANAASQTTISNIRDAVWDEEITSQIGTNTAGGVLYQAAAGTTLNSPVEVWSYATRTLTSSAGATAGDVWSYSDRTITGGSVTSVVDGVTVTTNNDKTGYDLSGTQSFNLTGNITGDLSGSVGSVTADVNVSTASMTGIASTVWDYVTRTLTSAAGVTAGDIWEYDISAITTAGTAGSQVNLAASPSGAGITAGDVWDYDIVNNTPIANSSAEVLSQAKYYADLAQSNTSNIGEVVWSYNPSYAGPIPMAAGYLIQAGDATTTAASDVWNYATRTLTSATGITAGDVWDYSTRTITGGSVTSVVNGVTVTTNNDKTGYSLSGTQSFNLTGNITGSVSGSVGSVTGSVGSVVSPVTVSTASMSGIANTVWTAPAKTITGGTVDTVTNPVSVSTTSMTGIAGTVWTYGTRTLTSGAGATAGDIWTYNISGITASGTAGATLNDASVSGSVVTIVNGPYRLTSIAEGTDGRIDILADSVQTIQLNCLDGFGQPFNVTGYAVLVNVYDVSGALAVTYTPTVDFASSGIVSFDIDTDVTGTTGRYTLVVELTAGAEVVQLGPLEILVRPL